MSTRNQAASRRARLGGAIASLFVVAAVLAGCSSSSDSDAAYVDSGADAEVAEAGAEPAFADAESAQNPQSPVADRSVIITGLMYMTVEDPIESADQAADIVQGAGGRIDARSETAPDERDGGSASLTLRIPSTDLDAVVDDLRDLGTVDQFSTDSYDVTTEVTDLDAQISTLRTSTARIEALLLEAKDIKDIITLENELDRRQAELEGLEARQRGLEDQVSMSTIALSLTTEPVVVVDDAPETFWDGLVAGWNGLVAFISVALVIAGVLLPWLIIMGLIALAIVLPIRARNARNRRRAAPPAPPIATAAPSPSTPDSSQTASATEATADRDS
ncbi:DUF4349 domain-containing protein [Demequina aurantiaca]|uniref:DUF4349 domain-containing protein n=1 Tax=Demequina aurantiaca TaxID=676200 RepID=UPI003D340BCA